MIAKLWHDQILAGKKQYSEVPARLKKAVADLLIASGNANLISE